MRSKRGIIGSFVSMFVATVVIVIILGILIIASGFVKRAVAERDNFGVQSESDVGIDGVLEYSKGQFSDVAKLRSYIDYRFSDMAQLRIIVRTGGNWRGWLTEEMKYGEK